MARRTSLIVGLGAAFTDQSARFNIGWRMVREFAAARGWVWQRLDEDGTLFMTEGLIEDCRTILMCLYGGSGAPELVQETMMLNSIPIENLLVIHVEMAYPYGRYHLTADSSSRRNRFVDDLAAVLGKSSYDVRNISRLVIGMNTAPEKVPRAEAREYLEQPMTDAEENCYVVRMMNQSIELLQKFALGTSRSNTVGKGESTWPAGHTQYTVGDFIGKGGFGYVYRGRDVVNNLEVVLKTLRADKLSTAGAEAVIGREICMLTAVASAVNVIHLLGTVSITIEKTLVKAMVMEYVNYVSFHDLYPSFTWDEMMTYLYKLLQALDSIHTLGVLHKDLKPNNVLYDPDLRMLRLIDWGLSSFYFDGEPTNGMAGSRPYRAPEQCLHHCEVGPGVDMWAFGCILGTLVFKPFGKIHRPFILGGERGSDNSQLTAICALVGSEDLSIYVESTGMGYGIMSDAEKNSLIGLPPRNLFAAYGETEFATEDMMDLLVGCLQVDPRHRLSAADALTSPIFKDVAAACVVEAQAQMDELPSHMRGSAAVASVRPAMTLRKLDLVRTNFYRAQDRSQAGTAMLEVPDDSRLIDRRAEEDAAEDMVVTETKEAKAAARAARKADKAERERSEDEDEEHARAVAEGRATAAAAPRPEGAERRRRRKKRIQVEPGDGMDL